MKAGNGSPRFPALEKVCYPDLGGREREVSRVSSGVYFARFEAAQQGREQQPIVQVQKLLLAR